MAPLRVPDVIVATYSDSLRASSDLPIPDFVRAPRAGSGGMPWRDVIAAGLAPGEHRATSDDLAVMPYTSGTTGKPKGCMHTHASVQATTVPYLYWRGADNDSVVLSALPMFHVTGMQAGINAPIHRRPAPFGLWRWHRACTGVCARRPAGTP